MGKLNLRNLKIGIVGLGYVGLPLAVEFGKRFVTVGFDIKADRVAELGRGVDSTRECDAQELAEADKLAYTTSLDDLKPCRVFIVTVPTPIDDYKRPDLMPLEKASESVGKVLKKGDVVTIDGSTGQVLLGEVPMLQPELSGEFATLMSWADAVRRLKVRTNAETPADARVAVKFGAEGIGLCRTEHMFFDEDRILAMREMICADDEAGRRRALAKILPMQRADFAEMFEIMAGLPVTIRLLDPPLHEFLPHADHEIEEVAEQMNANPDTLRARLAELKEFNPMLGHRGVRLLISYPEITDMQSRAIFEAATEVARRTGKAPIPEVMVPLVASKAEFDIVKARIVAVAEQVARETGIVIEYLVGTMIELPRAALRAAEIAESADFFSFGTNDLTQTTFGISRDDAARFIGEYTAKGILKADPFMTLDINGVGELVRIAAERGRSARPGIKLGICGEHGGDPASIAFCEQTGLDYVSCSPFRVPIARLAAAQASLPVD